MAVSRQKEQKTEMILHREPLWKGMFQLAIPLFFVNILKTMHDLVDGFFLGKVPDAGGVSVSTQMQTAVGLTWSIFFIFIAFGTGLSVAGNGLIGQSVGKNDSDGARKYAANTLILSLILGLFFNAFLFFSAPWLMKAMAAQGAEYEYAVLYTRIRSFELPILFLSYAFQAIRQATGDTTTPVLVSVVAIVINIILTPIMVLTLGWGIVGAGVSTLIANTVMLPIMLFLLVRPKTGIRIAFHRGMVDWNSMWHLARIAGPASVGQTLQQVGFVILNALIYRFGVEYSDPQSTENALSAAYYIGNRINSLVLYPVSSLSAVATIYIAQNIGAGNISRAKKAFRQGMFLCVGMMVVGMFLIIPFRESLVRLFNTNSQTVAFADEYMLYLHLGLPLMGIYNMYLAAFQGSGDTRYTLIMASVRLWAIRLPLVFLSVEFTDLGPLGVWYAMLISNLVMLPLGMYLYDKVDFLPKVPTVVSDAEKAPASA